MSTFIQEYWNGKVILEQNKFIILIHILQHSAYASLNVLCLLMLMVGVSVLSACVPLECLINFLFVFSPLQVLQKQNKHSSSNHPLLRSSHPTETQWLYQDRSRKSKGVPSISRARHVQIPVKILLQRQVCCYCNHKWVLIFLSFVLSIFCHTHNPS